MVRFLVLALLSLAGVTQTSASPTQASEPPNPTEEQPPLGTGSLSFPWSHLRLPGYIVPLHYHLLLHPNLTMLSYSGTVRIELQVQNNTNWVVLHSKGLRITTATMLDQNLAHLSDKVLPVLHNPTHEQTAIFSPRVLSGGQKYFLFLEFGAELGEGFYGFYRSTYRTSSGETRNLASTHFEPTSARMAFPCFDEPSFKANYSVSIRRSRAHIALSNMPVVDHKHHCHMFQVSVYAAPEKWQHTHYALKAAVKLLEFYEKYFNIKYPLPKQDLVAIPDFQAGAMENWGLITFRETSLLYDPATSSGSDRVWVTMVIAHELAHQWFGNLVTMQWWNDIWLNEGFARYMEYISVNATYPKLRVEDYLVDTCFAAIGRDSLNSSRPISSAAESPTQIEEMFDTVSYNKGACVLHMLRHYLTDQVFQSGIVRYLRRYSYSNAHNQDLWDSLANNLYAGEHLDLTSMMNTWTLQTGVPLVTVTRQGSHLLLKQERFLRTAHPSDPAWPSLQQGFLWHIPLTYRTDTSTSIHRHLMTTLTDSVDVGEEVGWVKVNVDMAGYYLVHYDGSGWDDLIQLLKDNHTALTFMDRTHLIHNAFQLTTAGRLSLDKALDLIGYLRSESHTVPLLEGLGYLEAFYRIVERRDIPDVTQNLRTYILWYFRDVIDRQTWSDKGSVSERRLRSELLSLACHLGDLPCLKQAQRSFTHWLDSNSTLNLPADVAETVYSVGAQEDTGWASLLQTYTHSLSETHKHKILSALASSRDTNKLTRCLGLEGEVIRTQDLDSLIAMVARNPRGHHLAWSYVQKYWSTLVDKLLIFPWQYHLLSEAKFCLSEGEGVSHNPRPCLPGVCVPQVRVFFESIHEQASQLRVTEVAMDNIQKNILWLQRNLGTLRSWLDQQID
uniref:Aminopeptidase n=1 Tax=Oncorhynchus mykiss TaxID=8022 RepID=A0A8K9XK09_ONCMY